MKRMKFLLVALSFVGAANTFAQETPAARGLQLSIGAEAALPIGSFHNDSRYKFGGGGSAKLAIPVATVLDFTVSAGYIAFGSSKLRELDPDRGTFTAIPFKAGLQVHTPGGLYFEPQVGFTQTKISKLEGAGVFTYAGNIGFLISKAVDIAVRYEAMASRKGTSITGATNSDVSAKFLGLRLAYNIPFARSK
ncbi:hypothetical protein [Segetibacter aerophilus]|uniref:Outer membrane protein beta-barrel domain-containing protein n=1 Tax=Segetibacter aerophilus TaxID=670293 RepID=A0A512BBU7_9BACT|nr:hypothetical protein [Segetibacter aerophilus]GEO09420.1 hypothetical protein SAE01_19160 [Segetibacter aerophilus]